VSTYREAYRHLGALLAWHEGREVEGPDVVWHPAYHHREPPLSLLATSLTRLLYWFYASQTKAPKTQKQMGAPAFDELLFPCEQHGARWPVMQIARLMSKLGMGLPAVGTQAESFFQETPARDLSELWPVKEVWESRVGALESLLRQEAERLENRFSKASIRLGWKLRDYGKGHIMVVPVEQKRTKTGGWTKGREIALYRLVNLQDRSLDYLTEQDKAVLAAVQRKQGYYGMIYQPDAGVALHALAGHPNVFWEDHPGLPVEIVRGTPEVRISPKGGRLRITMDPQPGPVLNGAASCITKESIGRAHV
jgi:hypothetical protein